MADSSLYKANTVSSPLPLTNGAGNEAWDGPDSASVKDALPHAPPPPPPPLLLYSPRRSLRDSRNQAEAAAEEEAQRATSRDMAIGSGRDFGGSPQRWVRKSALPVEARAPSPSPRRPARPPALPSDMRTVEHERAGGGRQPSVYVTQLADGPLAAPVKRTAIKGKTNVKLLEPGMWSNNANVRASAMSSS